MTGHFFFALLNPSLCACLAAGLAYAWRFNRKASHLLLLALSFVMLGSAFVANDFFRASEGPGLRIIVNTAFYAGITLAAAAALVRARIKLPIPAYAALSLVTAILFYWALVISPSTASRIYIVNAAYSVIAATTTWLLVKARPQNRMDWLFVGFALFLLAIAILRPLATFFGALEVSNATHITDSAYWSTVLAFTPLFTIICGVIFLGALLAQIFAELRAEANLDYLTGLLNRRAFDRAATSDLASSNTPAQPAAVMIADIDNFKTINDTYGHAVGDNVIKAVAKTLAEVSGADLVARTGGEEFSLFFRQSSVETLNAIAQNIRTELVHVKFPISEFQRYPSVSIGIRQRENAESLEDMLRKADDALYHAKRNGKDQSRFAA